MKDPRSLVEGVRSRGGLVCSHSQVIIANGANGVERGGVISRCRLLRHRLHLPRCQHFPRRRQVTRGHLVKRVRDSGLAKMEGARRNLMSPLRLLAHDDTKIK